MSRDLLVLSGGHPYEAEPFAALLASLAGWTVTHLIHPEAERLVGEGCAADADAMLFYDMPGYTFADGQVTARPPSEAFRRAIMARFAGGRGAVAMHHALAGWALWPEWHELLGGRFLYQPGHSAHPASAWCIATAPLPLANLAMIARRNASLGGRVTSFPSANI